MPRRHKRKLGSRKYKDYSNDQLEECLHKIRSGEFSTRIASKRYNIPRCTLMYKLKDRHTKPIGRPTILTLEEENIILERIQLFCDFGFPATAEDVCFYIKRYLDDRKRCVKQFKNNLPGREFIFSFLNRHKDYTKRITSNIKRSRASVSEDTIQEFHQNLYRELDGVPPSNIWNYDETCLVNEPGRSKCILKRGTRYPERIVESTKAGVSIMFCGNAEGEVLPPYSVYKSTAVMMDSWVRGGPDGAHYNRSKTGWFNECLFECWFRNMMLPRLKKQDGPKALIGDNLSSHISSQVIHLCKRFDIKFICLPPNSTHLTQPLDVAYFLFQRMSSFNLRPYFLQTKSADNFFQEKKRFNFFEFDFGFRYLVFSNFMRLIFVIP